MEAVIVLREQRSKKKKTRQRAVRRKVLLEVFKVFGKICQKNGKDCSQIQEIMYRLEECAQVLILEETSQILFFYLDDTIYSTTVKDKEILKIFRCFL